MASSASKHPFEGILTSLPALNDPRIDRLPYSIKILLESAIRNCDNFQISKDDVEKIIDWEITSPKQVEIPFKSARALLQDFTGVPAVIDLACIRDAMKELGNNSNKINPMLGLVIDHSVTVDVARNEDALQKNMELEFQRNKERFAFLKWGSFAFHNMLVEPPGSGLVHQVNLEYLARVVFNTDVTLYPDSVVGTDSHSNMFDRLGVAGWGVGGIEAEATMLGQPISMVLPGVVGFKLTGNLREGVTATDIVLTVTQMLKKHGVVGKFIKFYGPGMGQISLADKATIANMSPEYGATIGFFPVDHVTLQYLKLTGRSDEKVAMVESYLRANRMFIDYSEPQQEREYTSHLQLDLADVEPCVSGPKWPHDRVPLKDMKADWHACLNSKVGFKVDINFNKEPIGVGKDGNSVYFKDIWPSNQEIAQVLQSLVLPDMFKSTYEAITKGNHLWSELSAPSSTLYSWDANSTYIHKPPYFENMSMELPGPRGIKDAYCLLHLGDSITTDHISPGGIICKESLAAQYLCELGVDQKDINSYGCRRGNDEVMGRAPLLISVF